MRVSGHGLSIDAPEGWEVRIFARAGAAPVLHAATFSLSDSDGDFGAAATGRMRADDVFLALVQYRADALLRPGEGLFAAGPPAGLRAEDFTPSQLQVTRAGQLGAQRFYTDVDRPFCLYAVIHPAHRDPRQLALRLNDVLETLTAEG